MLLIFDLLRELWMDPGSGRGGARRRVAEDAAIRVPCATRAALSISIGPCGFASRVSFHAVRRRMRDNLCRSARSGLSGFAMELGNRAAGDYPLGGLSGDPCDEVVVAVVVQDGEAFSFGDGGNEEVGEADCSDLSAAPEGGLDLQGAVPVFVVGGEPFVAGLPVCSYLVELVGCACSPAQFEFDDAASADEPGFDQRAEHRGHGRVPQPG